MPDSIQDGNHPLFTLESRNKIAGLDFFIGSEEILGKGVSSMALNKYVSDYLASNYTFVVVDPHKDNIKAIKFFERNGFSRYENNFPSDYLLLLMKINAAFAIGKHYS